MKRMSAILLWCLAGAWLPGGWLSAQELGTGAAAGSLEVAAAQAEGGVASEAAAPASAEPETVPVTEAADQSGTETEIEAETETETETEPGSGSDSQEAEIGEPPAGAEADAAESVGAPLSVTVAVGAGVGTRRFRRPTPLGVETLPESEFPAVDAAVRVRGQLADHYALEVLVRYQGSLGMTVESQPPFALPVEHAARSQRVELSVAPVMGLGDGALAVSPHIGASLRGFAPDVRDQPTPAYYLVGPHLRLDLIVPVLRGLDLRLGPEAQWIIGINDSITEDGAGDSGLALGLEALVALELGERFGLELAYRQSHARVGHAEDGPDFEDVERFATLRVTGRL